MVSRVKLGVNYQKCSLTHPNYWIQAFQSLSWPQVYKTKKLGVEAGPANICERMGRSEELGEILRGTDVDEACTKAK